MFGGSPCMWCITFHIIFINNFDQFLSYLYPETSLIISVLNFKHFFITRLFLVSTERSVFGNFFLNTFIIFLILFHSSLSLKVFAPGLVDSPPTSIMFAPSHH